MKKYEQVKLTPAQDKLWSDTRVALLWNSPAFTHIFYTMMDTVGSKQIALFTKEVPIAATDGAALLLNPEVFFKKNLNQRLFIVAHEILHCILGHLIMLHGFRHREKILYPDGKSLPYIHEMMNVAMDLVINDILIDSKCGEFPPEGCHDKDVATAKDSCLEAYRKIYEDAERQGRITKKPGGGGYCVNGDMPGKGKGFDEHLAPGSSKGQDPAQAAQDHNQGKWNTEIAAAANAAKLQGKLPAGLQRLFEEVLNPQVDWKDKIRALFARKIGTGRRDWHRPDRRLISRADPIYAPGRAGFGAGTVVVGVDTSGSIGKDEINMFMAEVSGILEDVNPQRLVIMWCDAAVHDVDDGVEAEDLNIIRREGRKGGGGTSFIPVFDKVFELGLDVECLVYLTDGMGSFPSAPKFPVIWGSIYKESKYPFGDVVDVPKQAA